MKKQTIGLKLALGFISILSLTGLSQNQGNTWCFGHQAKLDFNTAVPTVGSSAFNGVYSGGGSSNEGVASISDPSGNLLFYTDGQIVYNKFDLAMPNGSGLLGNQSSTQSGIIVPKPGSSTQYFVFTVDAWGGSNLIKYNIVDLSLSTAGDVMPGKKNVSMPYSLTTPVHYSEKITAIPKAGGIGFWLVAHLSQESAGGNGTFVVWSIGCSGANDGISEMLVSSQRQNVGPPIVMNSTPNDGNTLGYMKVSSDNKKLAFATLLGPTVDVFDFNNATGVISNPKTINSTSFGSSTKPYGIEFSPNSNYLYVADFYTPNVYQYDVNAANINAPASFNTKSYTLTGPFYGTWGFYAQGALQLAKDGNIYIALPGKNHLARISSPNTFPMTVSTITESAIVLNANSYCTAGLPNFVTSFLGSALINVTGDPCSYTFSYSGSSSLPNATYQWNFGDGGTSTAQNPQHAYTTAGTFIITLTVTDPTTGCSATAQQSIQTTGCGCQAAIDSNFFKYLTNTTISTNTIWNNKIYVADNVIITVDNGVTLDITNVDVVFGHGAGIDFKNGAVIRANNSVFRPCAINEVWRGLDFYTTNSTPPSGTINECTFKNAKTSIEAFGATMNFDVRLTNNLFADCQRGIALSSVVVKRAITGNTYMMDNKVLPFNTVGSSLNAASAIDFYGMYTSGADFTDLISQNDFVFTSTSALSGAKAFGIYVYGGNNAVISENKFTNFIVGIYGNNNTNISIEDNTFSWTHLFNMATATGNKVQILLNYAQNALIKGNVVYNSNVMNSMSNTLANLATANIGIASNGSKFVTVSQNKVTGCEMGMVFNGIVNKSNQYLFITENEVIKSWYYGIYVSAYNDVDISCNKIDMELNSTRDVTGISYNNLKLGTFAGYYMGAVNVGIRGNCVMNTKNGIYCYNHNSTATVSLPKVYNNFVYNYRQYGFENNGFSATASTSPREVYHNSFVSNNSASGTVDINTDAPHPITLEANFGVQNLNAGVSMILANTQASSASCANQVGSYQNTLNSAQLCTYYFTGVSTNTWSPVAKMIPMNVIGYDAALIDSTDNVDVIDPLHTTGFEVINYKEELFDVYPNPAIDKINIAYNLEKIDNASLEFIDMHGKVVKTVSLSFDKVNMNIDVTDLATGVYMIRMINESKSVSCSKFVKY